MKFNYRGNSWGIGRAMRGNGRQERDMVAKLDKEIMQDIKPEATPYGLFPGYQAVERSYLHRPEYNQEKLSIDANDRFSEPKQNEMSDVAINTAGETKKVTDTDRAEIERAVAEINRSSENDIRSMFDEHRADVRDNSSEAQQEAYAITYEMIADRAAANDSALQELDTESIYDNNSTQDLEGILDSNQVNDELMDAIHELGVDDVNDAVPDEDELAEVLEYGGW